MKLLPSKTDVRKIIFFIVLCLTVRIQNGLQVVLFSGQLVLTMTLQLYGISKNDAKQNPAEYFQRDVENKEYLFVILPAGM
jgi:hypothetical protein